MRTLRRLVIALALLATLGVPAFADQAKRRDRSDRDSAERRHPRPGHSDRDRHRGYRERRPYRPHYRYRNPYQHHRRWYRSPRHGATCRFWVYGRWVHDRHEEWWVPGHYVYVRCR